MKKIGILTYHACFNYGACLQAYGLQNTIFKYQKDCEIIDFRTDTLVNISDVFAKNIDHPKELVKNITRMPYKSQLLKRRELFNSFITNDLKISRRCKTNEELERIAEEYECIVCGSDQTWNLTPSIRYQTIAYYLNFPKKQRRVTYATSFGDWVKEAPNHEDEIMPWIKTYDKLSMREISGTEYLQSRGLDCKTVLDPTLLLNKEEWDKICREPIMDKGYVLLFSWNGAKECVEAAKMIGKKLGKQVIYIVAPPRALFSGIKRKLDVGPKEFLSLVKNADFVITNSFHGTVFSTIYEKPFVSVVSGTPDARRSSLLRQLGLENHLITPDKIDIDEINNTDYVDVKNNLERLKADSLEYLKDAITF